MENGQQAPEWAKAEILGAMAETARQKNRELEYWVVRDDRLQTVKRELLTLAERRSIDDEIDGVCIGDLTITELTGRAESLISSDAENEKVEALVDDLCVYLKDVERRIIMAALLTIVVSMVNTEVAAATAQVAAATAPSS
jgi:hypothetical protein